MSKMKSASKAPQRPAKGTTAIKVTPVRLEPALRQGLLMLQGVLKMPMNKLVNQAVDDFIQKRAAEVETDLEAVLKQVKAYRKRDPAFKQAIRRTAEAEAHAVEGGVRDPAQGTTYRVRDHKAGPAQSMVRDLLGTK